MKKHIILLSAAGLLFSSCGVYTKYKPATEVPDGLYGEEMLFVVPVFYIIFEYLQEKVRPPMEEEADMQVLLEKQKSEAERAKD